MWGKHSEELLYAYTYALEKRRTVLVRKMVVEEQMAKRKAPYLMQIEDLPSAEWKMTHLLEALLSEDEEFMGLKWELYELSRDLLEAKDIVDVCLQALKVYRAEAYKAGW